jgi:uncharacterized protein (DUF2062 family)
MIKLVQKSLHLLTANASPKEIARGIALGLFLGMTPTVGIQTVAALLLAGLLKGNRLACLLGTSVSNPLTIPFIYYLNYHLGAKLLPVKLAAINDVKLTVKSIFSLGLGVALPLWAGGIVTGAALSLAGYFICLKVSRMIRAARPPAIDARLISERSPPLTSYASSAQRSDLNQNGTKKD